MLLLLCTRQYCQVIGPFAVSALFGCLHSCTACCYQYVCFPRFYVIPRTAGEAWLRSSTAWTAAARRACLRSMPRYEWVPHSSSNRASEVNTPHFCLFFFCSLLCRHFEHIACGFVICVFYCTDVDGHLVAPFVVLCDSSFFCSIPRVARLQVQWG